MAVCRGSMVSLVKPARFVRAGRGRGRWYELFRLSVEWQHQHQQSVTAPAPGDTYQPPAATSSYQQIPADISRYQQPG